MSKVQSITNNIISSNYIRSVICKVLIGSLILVGVAYVYFIGSITFNVLARRSLENKIGMYNSNISKLELTYFSNLSKINKDYAISKGYVDSKHNIFAIRSKGYVAIR